MLMGLDFYFLVIKEMACLQWDVKGNGESSGIWSLGGISKPIASRSINGFFPLEFPLACLPSSRYVI